MKMQPKELVRRIRDDARAVADWEKRAERLVPLADRVALMSPPILAAKFLRYALARDKRDAPADDPDARDPELVRLVLDVFRALADRYFRLEVRGIENVPAKGPALLVGNHNGAFLPTDGFFTSLAICDRYGPGRAVYSLAHDFLFCDSTLRRYALRLGALRAGHAGAMRVFERGGLVLVYPGSDLDTFRPWSERNRVVLGGRKGFITLALRAGVPIIPVLSAGTHEQLVVLTRGDRLAELLRTRAWARTVTFPIVLSVPWGITTGFLPYLPLPAQTTLAFGEPISWPELGPEDAGDPAILERAYREVESKMQAILDRLTVGRRPFLGQPRPPARRAPGETAQRT